MGKKKVSKKKVPASPGAARRKTEKPLRLEVGKYYLSEKKIVVGPLAKDGDGDFTEPTRRAVWIETGACWWAYGNTAKDYGDLIREVKAPKKARKA